MLTNHGFFLVNFRIIINIERFSFGRRGNTSTPCTTDYLKLDLDPLNSAEKKIVRLCGSLGDFPLSYVSYNSRIKLTIVSLNGWLAGQGFGANYTMGKIFREMKSGII